jgi:hypothetical protein
MTAGSGVWIGRKMRPVPVSPETQCLPKPESGSRESHTAPRPARGRARAAAAPQVPAELVMEPWPNSLARRTYRDGQWQITWHGGGSWCSGDVSYRYATTDKTAPPRPRGEMPFLLDRIGFLPIPPRARVWLCTNPSWVVLA